MTADKRVKKVDVKMPEIRLSLEVYSRLTDPVEVALDQADYLAEYDSRRMTHDEVFSGIRESLNVKQYSPAWRKNL